MFLKYEIWSNAVKENSTIYNNWITSKLTKYIGSITAYKMCNFNAAYNNYSILQTALVVTTSATF